MKRAVFAFAATWALATGAYAGPAATPAPEPTPLLTPAGPGQETHPASARSAEAAGLVCDTQAAAGQSCVCAKAPEQTGQVEVKDGRAICVAPAAHHAS